MWPGESGPVNAATVKIRGNLCAGSMRTVLLAGVVLSVQNESKFLAERRKHYELKIRGINSEADVQTLRKLFRSVVEEGLPIDLCNLYSLSVDELFGCIASKIVELRGLVT